MEDFRTGTSQKIGWKV